MIWTTCEKCPDLWVYLNLCGGAKMYYYHRINICNIHKHLHIRIDALNRGKYFTHAQELRGADVTKSAGVDTWERRDAVL